MSEKKYQFIVKEEQKKMRVDQFLEQELTALGEDVSRSFIQTYFDHVLVNNRTIKKSYRLKQEDVIQFITPKPPIITLIPEEVEFETVYEDESLIIVNKPAGLVVHPAKGNYSGTLVHGLLHKMIHFDLEQSPERPGIVHRLDKDTSGLMVVAKTVVVQRKLMMLFSQRLIEKEYTALIKGRIPLSGKVEKKIERHPIHRKKFRVGIKGKEALTFYQRQKYYSLSHEENDGYSLVNIKLVTGRTHQIRVHLSSIGHPVIGDPIYSKPRTDLEKRGLTLCARRLGFTHPITQKEMKFEIELPDYFKEILTDISQRTEKIIGY